MLCCTKAIVRVHIARVPAFHLASVLEDAMPFRQRGGVQYSTPFERNLLMLFTVGLLKRITVTLEKVASQVCDPKTLRRLSRSKEEDATFLAFHVVVALCHS